MKRRVLVLEDEDSIRSFIVVNLEQAGYIVLEAAAGFDALNLIKNNPDIYVAICDVMLPDMDGFEVCRRIRSMGLGTGILMLTALTQESNKITGLSAGADDYVTKPFSVLELVARVDALCRRVAGGTVMEETTASSNILRSGGFILNTANRELRKNGIKIELTQVELLIMKTFLENKGRALSREDILSMVWGSDYSGEIKVVDVNIRRLRLKIEENAAEPNHIATIWGFGYRWQD